MRGGVVCGMPREGPSHLSGVLQLARLAVVWGYPRKFVLETSSPESSVDDVRRQSLWEVGSMGPV